MLDPCAYCLLVSLLPLRCSPSLHRSIRVRLSTSPIRLTVPQSTGQRRSLSNGSRSNGAKTPKGYFYAAARYAASEHGGTHFDSPIHFSEGKQTIDQIPASKLVGKALVVDVRPKVGGHPDSLITAQDLLAWEKVHGKIQEGSIVIALTGWGQYWPDKKKYIGTDKPGDVANLHFPGYAKDGAELLASRKVAGVGIDTASLDYGQSQDFISHQVLNGANIYGLENVANLEKLPATGATVIALPMKIGGGSGAPLRAIAILP